MNDEFLKAAREARERENAQAEKARKGNEWLNVIG